MVKVPKTGSKSPDIAHKSFTTAHLVETVAHELGHTMRHHIQLGKDKTAKAKALDYKHTDSHLNRGINHIHKLADHLISNYPAEGKELVKLQTTIGERVHNAYQKVK